MMHEPEYNGARSLRGILLPLHRLLACWRRRVSEEDGVAAIEFALIAPILIILLLGASEMFLMHMASRKMTRVTNTVGDLITQAKGTLKRRDIKEYYKAAKVIMGQFPRNRLALSVFTYTWDRKRKRARLSWRMNLGSFVCRSNPPRLTADQRASMQDGNDLVITHGCYNYKVQIGTFVLGNRTIRMTDEVALRPRQQLRVVCKDCSS